MYIPVNGSEEYLFCVYVMVTRRKRQCYSVLFKICLSIWKSRYRMPDERFVELTVECNLQLYLVTVQNMTP